MSGVETIQTYRFIDPLAVATRLAKTYPDLPLSSLWVGAYESGRSAVHAVLRDLAAVDAWAAVLPGAVIDRQPSYPNSGDVHHVVRADIDGVEVQMTAIVRADARVPA